MVSSRPSGRYPWPVQAPESSFQGSSPSHPVSSRQPLTRLPAKYVVATRADLVPLLSVYEGRYNAAVVSQVMRACNRVADQPRHKKP